MSILYLILQFLKFWLRFKTLCLVKEEVEEHLWINSKKVSYNEKGLKCLK